MLAPGGVWSGCWLRWLRGGLRRAFGLVWWFGGFGGLLGLLGVGCCGVEFLDVDESASVDVLQHPANDIYSLRTRVFIALTPQTNRVSDGPLVIPPNENSVLNGLLKVYMRKIFSENPVEDRVFWWQA